MERADAGDPGRGESTAEEVEGREEVEPEVEGREGASFAFIDLAKAKAPLEGSSSLNSASRFLAAFSSRVNPTGSVSFVFPFDFDFVLLDEDFDFVAFFNSSV